MLQAILFNKKFYTLNTAKKWLNEHSYIPIKPAHETDNYFRFRMNQPEKGRYYTVSISPGILLVYIK